MNTEDAEAGLKGKDKIFAEAKRRYKAAKEWESPFRKLFVADLKFDAADPDNQWQWPENLMTSRNDADRPSLTINKTRQHNKQIINDGKQNTPSIKIRPVGNEATAASADIYNGIMRRIEYQSNAKSAYDTAYSFAVRAGIGYWRVQTEFIGDDTFDQDLFIRRIKNPLSVYLDPDINELDGSDARFGFVFEDCPRDEVLAKYPDLRDRLANDVIGDDDWITKDNIRVAEYYRKVSIKDRLVLMTEPPTMPDGQENPRAGQTSLVKASTVPKQILDLAIKAPDTKIREISRDVVEWFKIVGDQIVDEQSIEAEKKGGPEAGPYPIPYIPIVRVIGEETVIEGRLERKGHTRALKDPQRMFNYNASASVEFGALQSKTPYIAPVRAIEGQEDYWRTANRVNHDVLPYNDIDDQGKPIAPPQRQQPPTAAPAFLQGMQDADHQMMMVSGQYQSQTGEQENAKSGKAINARQRQGDNATYDYIDNLAAAVRFTGKICMAWAPYVYDTQRVFKILGEDGTEKEVKLDPTADKALIEKRDARNKVVENIFNPKVGKYDVQSDVGPGYATKRQEAFNAFSQIAIANPDAMNTIGDYVFMTMDVPYSQEIAERYRRKIPPAILGEGPGPEVVDLQKQLENVKGILTNVVTELAEKDMELKGVRADKSVQSYKAGTERMTGIAKLGVGVEILAPVIAQAVLDALQQQLPEPIEVQQPADMQTEGQDLPPLNDMAWDQRAQIDAALSNGNPVG